ncbi:spore germination protein [Bacillus sp. BHET2]|uniref:spore germination protein n=1 Tax=Bacillus sp. BHET2 TaxID=2583818 RepID=UPI00110E35B5|nr:spore germination protein [Bacillus sp. BHET2]TMU88361.1 spore germination protein [Bacillus sp. BHET2]
MRYRGKNRESFQRSNENVRESTQPVKPLSENVMVNIEYIQTVFGHTSDLHISDLVLKERDSRLVYLNGMVDHSIIENFELALVDLHLERDISSSSLPGDIEEIDCFDQLIQSILSGETAILIEGVMKGFILKTSSQKVRDVSESTSEQVVRGPKEAFTETLQTNTALIRRKIKDANLWSITRQVGQSTQTDVSVLYINGVADEKIVKEVLQRIDRIDIDGILEGNYIEELIEDPTYSPFPTVYNTERPDGIAAGLLEGRIAILVDGTPFALLVPALFVQFFQSAEDYYQRWDIASLIRILRVFSLFMSLLGPSLYIALSTFHQEMMPTNLLISLAAQRQGVPFPALFEAVLMEITLEILREAGIRLPKTIGQTVSIVGALVIGQAAVEAGFVSPAMVIVVSFTAISNFVLPSYNIAISIRILRFLFMILAATLGLYGMALGLFALSIHLCGLRSFGVPYMSPIAPYVKQDQKDTLLRLPRKHLVTRPRLISQKNIVRQGNKSE